ncbi:TPA_asm: ead/Ea22-like family protein [Salmonella enterica]|nr:ead/Ea22-like family protein [Salmonella enterica]
MTALNKQALRSKARSASAGEWIKESGDGWEAICSADDQANGNFIIAHFEGLDAQANREFVQAANPATFLALLDELEAAERRIAELNKRLIEYAGIATREARRVAELGSFHTAYLEWSDKTEWVQTDKRFDAIKPWGKHRADVLKEYIEHLEARQIALPQRLSPEGYHIDEAYMVDDAEGEYLDRDAVIEAIRAAGIGVKGE